MSEKGYAVRFNPGYLGFQYKHLSVTGVDSRSQAARSKLVKGWRIHSINGYVVSSDEDVARHLYQLHRMPGCFIVRFLKPTEIQSREKMRVSYATDRPTPKNDYSEVTKKIISKDNINV